MHEEIEDLNEEVEEVKDAMIEQYVEPLAKSIIRAIEWMKACL